ncbi:hypothetical protein JCGZ_00619 [Jatropha curcas]|uniref:Uncharacterized protein n=1 Tax=Jatropha curcas TaxID=180498 RepID=A0A067JDD3_JATCU|nr:hypothetical protein JCGZ_00619 [Jatropha curcas]
MNLHKSLDLGKPTYLSKPMEPVIGNGIIRANDLTGPIRGSSLLLSKAENMMGLMEESTIAMIRRWQRQVESNGGVVDIGVDKDLKSVAAVINSKACFSSSYSQGKQIFSKLRALQAAISQPNLLFGLTNFRQERGRSNKYEEDLLQVIPEIAENSEDLQHISSKDRFIIDNCKNIYFAGHETTALTASWCLLLLALHPEWQERVRAEIAEICGDNLNDCLLDLDKLRQSKTLNMVIQETLLLYGPAVIAAREAFADIKLGDMTIPKGTNIWILITALHRDPENWGPDANEFKPDRFAQGIIEACKFPQLYIPFGFGSRLCFGQTFAML